MRFPRILGLFAGLFFATHAMASSYSAPVVIYNAFQFGQFYEGQAVSSVVAIPEVVLNTGARQVGESVTLKLQGGPGFSGKSITTAWIYKNPSSGEDVEPRRIEVRYIVYLQDGSVAQIGPFAIKAGKMHSVYAKPDTEAAAIRAALEKEFRDLTAQQIKETKNLFYLNGYYTDVLNPGIE